MIATKNIIWLGLGGILLYELIKSSSQNKNPVAPVTAKNVVPAVIHNTIQPDYKQPVAPVTAVVKPVDIPQQIDTAIQNNQAFTPQQDISILQTEFKNMPNAITPQDAGLLTNDISETIFWQSISNSDTINECMRNANTSEELEYCKNTAASADAR